MGLKSDVEDRIGTAISQNWKIRDGQVVPATTDVALSGGGVKLNSTILYSDIARSTELAMHLDRRVAARIAKAFMSLCARISRFHGGAIRSFDGDRLMAIFIGNNKNTRACKASLQINWAFTHILKPRFENAYPKIKDQHPLAYCSGVDTSEVLAVRGGIRDNNDLVWIGRAPNIAAKLSEFRATPYTSYITASVYNKITDEARKAKDGRNMWEERTWTTGPVRKIYRSKFYWIP